MAEHIYVYYFIKLIFTSIFNCYEANYNFTNFKPYNTGKKKVEPRLQKGDNCSRWRMTYGKGNILF